VLGVTGVTIPFVLNFNNIFSINNVYPQTECWFHTA